MKDFADTNGSEIFAGGAAVFFLGDETRRTKATHCESIVSAAEDAGENFGEKCQNRGIGFAGGPD